MRTRRPWTYRQPVVVTLDWARTVPMTPHAVSRARHPAIADRVHVLSHSERVGLITVPSSVLAEPYGRSACEMSYQGLPVPRNKAGVERANFMLVRTSIFRAPEC